MGLSKIQIVAFRLLLVIAVVAILALAVTPIESTLMVHNGDKLGHITAFLVLAFLADFSFPDSEYMFHKILPLFAFGVLIEFVQLGLTYRSFSGLDLVADAVGLLLYGVTLPWLRRWPLLNRR